jgi:CcmD family protein
MLRHFRAGVLTLIASVCLCCASSQLVAAQAPSAGEERASSFQAVSGAVKEDVAGGPLMLAAYAVVWLVLFGYVFRMVRLQRGVEDNLERLERAVGSAAPHDETVAR